MDAKILLIDDEQDILDILEMAMEPEGFQVKKVLSANAALELYKTESFDLAITDIRMPGMDGLELIKHLKTLDQDLEIIVLTGFATIDNAIEALRAYGAFDFLQKPLRNVDELFYTMQQALEKRRLRLENKKLFEELELHKDHLEKLVAQRTKALRQEIKERKQAEERLRQAKEAAEAANQTKSEFLSRVSHELRTPLNIISGMAYILSTTHLTGEQREYVHDIQSASNAFLDLIEEILDFSNIENGKFTSMSVIFNLDEILETISASMYAKLEETTVQFRTEISQELPRPLVGNPRGLKKILVHLLDNAVKFTETGEIVLTIVPMTNEKDPSEEIQLSFSIRDTGFGIPPEIFSSLFEMFNRDESSNAQHYSGVGLGLALSKRLVELQGGKIRGESEPGVGTTFYFSIPFGRPPANWKSKFQE